MLFSFIAKTYSNSIRYALLAIRLARKLNFGLIDKEFCQSQKLLSYSPVLSELFGKRIALLSGWSEFENSVKAFQVFGLIAETIFPIFSELEVLQDKKNRGVIEANKQLEKRKQLFLISRKNREGNLIFQNREITREILEKVDPIYLALWEVFAHRSIVCTTSSNFGLSWHNVLTCMQKFPISLKDRNYHILNQDEGNLVIWCPRRGSDIMRYEKDDILQETINSSSLKCHLSRYDSREERDIKALNQVIETSGYFFPTTPQSEANVDKILASIFQINPSLKEEISQTLLNNLRTPIRGAIYGAIIPYLSLLDEFIHSNSLLESNSSLQNISLLSVYNPTSIGATLASFVAGDMLLHTPDILSRLNQKEMSILESEFPTLKKYLEAHNGYLDFKLLIHAIPDHHTRPGIAGSFNVSSSHTPGDGKKFMGLGSSGFSNNSLLQTIIIDSVKHNGAFKGKTHIHPTTHTMGYIAAALTFASEIEQHGNRAKLPELAGSFAIAGILQEYVDRYLLSPEEVAWTLKKVGIGLNEFIDLNPEDYQTPEGFIKRVSTEGEAMESFGQQFIAALKRDFKTLSIEVSKIRAARNSKECSWFPLVVAHRTGDYCTQPSQKVTNKILDRFNNFT
ncbi:hypothetical protein IQ249_00070 [Lusitaniella coriacea LEGE 07157]|uniref:Uncharacterized protein n=1 Tax=Lusitaniella coriacea LEGE 07157 TaxID=945747 RepID=A0A8J7AQY0_9CYAN|nr:hypothetical protein [Lusitaniella coriacea]MBE9114281.1 hypothetical protein [Lusitaniella coriacea LEGE 07157]